MNTKVEEQAEVGNLKVLSLFQERRHEDILGDDPLRTLLEEAALSDDIMTAQEVRVRKVVQEDQFPDQSIHILDEQIHSLKASLARIKFYLGELDDILPR